MSFLDTVGGLLDRGLDIYEKKELADMGLYETAPTPNTGTTGTGAGLPDQTAVYKPQDLGPVPAPSSSQNVQFLGLTMDKNILQATALVVLVLWFAGKFR